MKIQLRTYQALAVSKTFRCWTDGCRSVLVVAPPASGKTEIGIGIILAFLAANPTKKVVWVSHTRDLVFQARDRIAEAMGEPVNAIVGGTVELSSARVTVAIVHSLLDHSKIENVGLVVLDEAHHYAADKWCEARNMFAGTPLELGLTATPQRHDGRALGDIFQEIVVAAQYSELIREGWIVPAVVVSPVTWLRTNYAQHPVDAWSAHSGGRSTICFYPLIETAEMYDREFGLRGVASQLMHSKMSDVDRRVAFESFERGDVTVLSTVSAAIEGLNVPHCGAVVLGRSFEFVGAYQQAVGRVLRGFSGKECGVVIDLTGASRKHGAPDIDREYSLTGTPISGGTGGTGGGGDDRKPPDVLGLSMKKYGNWPQEIERVELIPPDPKRLERRKMEMKKIKRMRTRHGEGAARMLRLALEAGRQ